MKFKKEMRTNENMCCEFLKTQIGKTFNVTFSLLYPHGKMVTNKLLKVESPTEWHNGYVEFEATFPDGYKANYCTSICGFFCEFERQF